MLLLLLGLCACSPKEPQRGEVAVRVNGTEIPVERFRQVLAQGDSAAGAQPAAARLMEAMVDRELLAQQARKIHLDRNALVVHALDGAQTGILAQAYVEHVALGTPLEASEVEDFYSSNPALFQGRRIYRIFELAVIASSEHVAALQARMPRTRSILDIAEWLKARGIAFNVGGVTSPTERIAPELMQRLDGMKDGQLGMVAVPGGASVIQLIQSQNAPLSLAEARPVIERLLQARKQAEVGHRQVEQLRSAATIQYLIDLGEAAPQAQGATPVAARP
jgi:EpsD family peptidyl-prolyl cis-trans isomerase